MPSSCQRREEKYSSATGVIFLFNLIVGTGALALPSAFEKAGWLLGIFLLFILSFVSFITVTFVIEALAAANASVKKRCANEEAINSQSEDLIEQTPLVPQLETQENVFEITEKYEIGYLGVLLTPKWCQIAVYLCLCIYLFGDVSIYAVVIGKSGSHVLCSYRENTSNIIEIPDNWPCWEDQDITRLDVYRFVVFIFILLLGPFVFFNLQKTKLLQIFSSIMRWMAFFVMIIWSICKLCIGGPKGHPSLAEFKSLPTLFGTLVYSFMCQHSIPGLVHPISNKKDIKAVIGTDFALVSIFYTALVMTAVFTFHGIQDIYTLNFWEESIQPGTSKLIKFFAFFLALFPILTISASFPIIAITLRNNLRCMILNDAPYCWYYDKLLLPLISILPACFLALAVPDVHLLVGIVGSYAGTCVQYLIPCLLVHFARSQTSDFQVTNIHASPFKSAFWIYAVYMWMVISLIFITMNFVIPYKKT